MFRFFVLGWMAAFRARNEEFDMNENLDVETRHGRVLRSNGTRCL
jgi:hypothetical protein